MKNFEEITEAIRQLIREENKNVNNLICRPSDDMDERQKEIDKTYNRIYRLEAAQTVLTIS